MTFVPCLSRILAARPLAGLAGLFALVLTVLAATAYAQDRPSEDALREIETRGRRIAGYHEAVNRARQRFQGLVPDEQRAAARFVVVDRNGAWKVIALMSSGTDPGSKSWQMLAEFGFNPKAGEVTTVERFLPPRQAPTDAMVLMRAIDVSASMIGLHVPDARAPFLEAAFREPDKTYTVHLQPVPEKPGAARFGGDLLAQISSDGSKLLKAQPAHGSSPMVEVSPGAAGEATVHSHVEGDLPTETDVALVLDHPKIAPHLVLTPRHMFRIDQAGAITYLGANPVPPAAPGGTL